MRTVPGIIFLMFIFITAKAQQTTLDTLPYAMEYHQKRLDVFKNETPGKNKIVFIGNSITEFGDWKVLLKDSSVINRGIAGDITFGVINRLDEVVALQPSKLFIEIGINDISKNIPAAVIAKNILTIVQRIKSGSPKTEVFVQSILPTNDSTKKDYPEAYHKNGQVIKTNRLLQGNAAKAGYTYIDLYPKFHDKDGSLDVKYAEDDGIHPNLSGYLLWIKILKAGHYL
jgi:lysophospholipase L1-like esterase